MKKIFITTLLFFLALTLLGSSLQKNLEQLLRDSHINLTIGITLPKDTKPFNQFNYSDIPATNQYYEYAIDTTPDGYINPYKAWYEQDFASDPFDGRIEVYVMGEPLPSATQTVFITLAVLGILLYCRDTKWKQLKIR